MSVASARSKLLGLQQQIAKLHGDKAREAGKIAGLTSRASSAQQAAAKATNASSAASKLREFARLQDDIAAVHKRIADFDARIGREEERLADAQKELAREEAREREKLQREEQRRAKDSLRRMQEVTAQLTKHDSLHREAMSAIERLSQLPEQITVLFLASNPAGEEQLRLDEEARAIAEKIRLSAHRNAVRFESRWAVRPGDVLQAINELAPRVVHFSGHGAEGGELVFQDRDGNAKLVSVEAIVQTIQATSDIQLVFFNTCFSHHQAEAVVRHVKAAVGMTEEIGDEAAREFAAQFYSAIGFGKSVKVAFEQAKAILMLEGILEEDTPVLKTADGISPDDLVLVRPAETN